MLSRNRVKESVIDLLVSRIDYGVPIRDLIWITSNPVHPLTKYKEKVTFSAMDGRRQVEGNSPILMGGYEPPPLLYQVALQGIEHSKQKQPSYYLVEMVEDSERTNGPNGIWDHLGRNKAIAVKKIVERMKG